MRHSRGQASCDYTQNSCRSETRAIAADNLQISERTWNQIEVADRSTPDTPVYYSVFSTYEGRGIFTVTLYYLEPNMEQVQQFGRPVLQDFSVL